MEAACVNNRIHPTAIIGKNVQIGENNSIGAFCIIEGDVTIGDNNVIYPHVLIGSDAQMHFNDLKGKNNVEKKVIIGDENYIREFVTIHSPSYDATLIGNRNIFMAYSHIPHDATIENSVKITNNVQIGGFSTIQSYAYLGLSSTIQQRVVVGYAAITGMGTVLTNSIAPFSTYVGNPQEFKGINLRGLRKMGWENSKILNIKKLFKNYENNSKFDLNMIQDVEINLIFESFTKAQNFSLRG